MADNPNCGLGKASFFNENIKQGLPFRFPTTNGTAGQVLRTDGAGNLSWVASSGGGSVEEVGLAMGVGAPLFSVVTSTTNPITATGTFTLNYSGFPLPILNGGTNAGSFVNAGVVAYNGASLASTSTPTLGSSLAPGPGIDGTLTIRRAAHNFTFVMNTSNTQSANTNWVLPDANAAVNGYVLSSTTGGVLSWVAAGAGTVTSVNMSVPSFLTIAGNPVTGSGTLAVGLNTGVSGLPVTSGGTGMVTIPNNSIMYTSALNTLTTASTITGSVLVADGAAPSFSRTLTLGAASSVAGSIVLRNATNANTITIQPGATSNPGNVVLTLPTTDGNSGEVLSTNGSGVLSWVAAPTTPVSVANGGTGLTSFTPNVVLASDGAGTAISQLANLTGSVLVGNGGAPSFSRTLRLGATSGTAPGTIIIQNGSNSFTTSIIASTSTGASYTMTLPVDVGTTNQVLATDGASPTATLSWLSVPTTLPVSVSQGGTGVTTLGAGNRILYTSSASTVGTLGNTAGTVLVGDGAAPSFSTTLTLGAASATSGIIILRNSANAFTTTIQPSTSIGASYTLTLPVDDGSADQLFKTNGSGVTAWISKLVDTSGGTNSLILGTGTSGTSGTNVTAFGVSALASTSGSNNTGVGYRALFANIGGSSNTAVGSSAMIGSTTAIQNTAVGYASLGGALVTGTGDNNTALGYNALATTVSNSNTAVGSSALAAGCTSGNTAVGFQALILNTAADNTAVGANALDACTGGTRHTAIGASAGSAVVGNNDTTAVGYNALLVNTASGSTAVGSLAMDANTSGQFNTALGYNALGAIISNNSNTAVGYNALAVTTVSNNTAVGANSLDSCTTGTRNTGVGVDTLTAITATGANAGDDNTAVGYRAAYQNTGTRNTVIGSNAFAASSGAYDNVAIGNNASNATTGNQNTSIGASALVLNVSGTDNTAIGFQALNATTTSGNTAIGSEALENSTTATGCTAIGYQALQTLVGNCHNNTAVGYQALKDIATGSTIATANTAIGAFAGANITSGDNNVAIGFEALFDETTGSNNTAIGYQALANNNDSFNTAIGASALAANVGGTGCTAVGFNALAGSLTDHNTAVGSLALASTSGAECTAIGYSALTAATGDSNTAIGSNALLSCSSGTGNTAIGASAGDTITTGGSNIIIGNQADVDDNNATGRIVIGTSLTGTENNRLYIKAGSSVTFDTGFETYNSGTDVGTLTNAPAAGNPTGYLRINLNGVEHFIPYWS